MGSELLHLICVTTYYRVLCIVLGYQAGQALWFVAACVCVCVQI